MDPNAPPPAPPIGHAAHDERALGRYRDLLRMAPPEAIERAHAEAIAALAPAQRRQLLRQVGELLPPAERVLAGPSNDTPHGLARLITRALRQGPAAVERLLATPAGLGRVLGAALLGGVLGAAIGGAMAAPSDDLAADGAALEPEPAPAEPDLDGLAASNDASFAEDVDLGDWLDL